MRSPAHTAAAIAMAVCLLLAPAAAHAAFPGTNGKLAFSSSRSGYPADADLYTMAQDGTNQTRITSLDHDETSPAWSPSGAKIAFQQDPGLHPEIWSANADGSGRRQLTTNGAADMHPAWSWNGAGIVFASDRDSTSGVLDLFTMDANGTAQVNITNTPNVSEDYPTWSSDGTKIAFSRDGDIYTIKPDGTGLTPLTQTQAYEIEPDWSPNGAQIVYRTAFNAPDEIWKMNADGSGQTNLTHNGTVVHEHPVWSPAGDKVAFTRGPFGRAEVYTMTPDGGLITQVTSNAIMDAQPAWQPIPVPRPGFPRPKGADSVAVAIVPTFKDCKTGVANRWHGPPLQYKSCNPPKMLSRYLTIGTPEVNGQQPRFSGRFVTRVIAGNPATAADEADVLFNFTVLDVRKKADLADYTGELRVRFQTGRLTDAFTRAPAGGYESGTAASGSIGFTVPCAATSDTKEGGKCTIRTTLDSIAPGFVTEKARAIWALGAVQVMDGGPDGSVATPDGDMFAVQGIYVP